MDRQSMQQILTCLNDLHTRVSGLEQRVTAVEQSLGNLSGPSTTGRAPRRPNRNGNAPNRAVGSSENAGFLPFVIETLAWKDQNRATGDNSKCSVCPRETFHLNCFREGHFHWCRVHGRPILHNHPNCGRDYTGCQRVHYEVHPDWINIVRMSMSTGLGAKGVTNLNYYLFHKSDFPHLYDANGWCNPNL